jgi:hypothetical protein
MPVIAWVKYKGWHNHLMTLKTIATIIGLIVVCRMITTTYAYLFSHYMYEEISNAKKFEIYNVRVCPHHVVCTPLSIYRDLNVSMYH